MKKNRFQFILVLAILSLVTFISCEKNQEEFVIPKTNPSATNFDINYKEGNVSIDINSNVIVYATIDEKVKTWLTYKYKDSCQTLVLNYLENNTPEKRVGKVSLFDGDSTITVTVNQAGNPFAVGGGVKTVSVDYKTYTVDYAGTPVTLFEIAKDQAAKIPIGAYVQIACSNNNGTIMLVGSNPLISGKPVNGKFLFAWTKELAAGNGVLARLDGGFTPVSTTAFYSRKNHAYTISTVNYGGTAITLLSVAKEDAANIPIGSNVVIECPSDKGTIMLVGSNPLISGSPVNGKFTFTWTQAMASGGGILARIDGGFDPKVLYSVSFKTDLKYDISTVNYGGTAVTLLVVSADQAANIPIGATVVAETSSDSGTIMLVGSNPLISGSPVNSKFIFSWTSAMAGGSGILGRLDGGFTPTSLYVRN